MNIIPANQLWTKCDLFVFFQEIEADKRAAEISGRAVNTKTPVSPGGPNRGGGGGGGGGGGEMRVSIS